MMRILLFALSCWVAASSAVLALSLEELEQDRQRRVKEIRLTGHEVFSAGELLSVLLTKERAWYLPRRERPVCDPVTFRADTERLRRFYEAHGYYQAHVTYELHVDESGALVTLEIHVDENRPVIVAEVAVAVADAPAASGQATEPGMSPGAIAAALRGQLALHPGAIFTEEAYHQSEQIIRNFFLQRGHAHVQTTRRAEVDLDQRQVSVRYTADPGPRAVFGETRIEGTEDVDPYLVWRELVSQAGEQFSEGSVELRRPPWRALTGALFLDFGQVALDAVDMPIDDLEFAAGVGVSYATPVGPLRLDIGFPFDPPRGDQAWQLHFSIGQFF